MTRIIPLLFVALLSISPVSWAGDDQSSYQVQLSATVSEEISNDKLVAILLVQETGTNPAVLASRVNQKMATILSNAETYSAIDSKTTSYTTQPIYKNGVIRSWQVRQQLELSSQNFEQLGELIANTNQLANVQSMSFSISDEALEQIESQLTKKAIAKFRSKAAMITKEFGKSKYILIHANVGTTNSRPPRPVMARTLSIKADTENMSQPAMAAGSNKVSINVNGQIELM